MNYEPTCDDAVDSAVDFDDTNEKESNRLSKTEVMVRVLIVGFLSAEVLIIHVVPLLLSFYAQPNNKPALKSTFEGLSAHL